MLFVALPLIRDLLIRRYPASGARLAALAHLGLLAVAVIAMRVGRVSAAEAGIRSLAWRSAGLGAIAGLVIVFPVWRLPFLSIGRLSWLLAVVALEEVAFRGVLFALLRRAGGLPLAIGGSALAFTLAHVGSAGVPGLTLVALAGLFLGLLRAMRGDLWTPAIAHLLIDLVSLP